MESVIRGPLKKLDEMRSFCGERFAAGLSLNLIEKILPKDPRLVRAIDKAFQVQSELRREYPELLRLPEKDLIGKLQEGICNFYGADMLKPYVPIAAQGPWMISVSGAVIYNVGSYGMLAFGDAPPQILKALNREHVMANVMTASFSQKRFIEKMRREIGHMRFDRGGCPYHQFICLNSGSEAVTLASTLADVNAKTQTDPGGLHAGKKIMFMSLKGSFHGRTGRAARLSDSTAHYYDVLASRRDKNPLITVPVNDCAALQKAFAQVDEENVFIDSFFMEPVMGEGNPGKAVTPEFYALARKLTQEHNSLFVVDSIQAGFRAQGCLSIVDYPGFENMDPPDMETFSKALNAGQFPVSVLAMMQNVRKLYHVGIYGNTMTTNPRALDVMIAMLDSVTPELRKNIQERGVQMLTAFKELQLQYPVKIESVQGCGLLLSISLNPQLCKAGGRDSLELFMRRHGVNVIHGGKNALRFTPCLDITAGEVDLVLDVLEYTLSNGPALSLAA